jgi:hypothetical protein
MGLAIAWYVDAGIGAAGLSGTALHTVLAVVPARYCCKTRHTGATRHVGRILSPAAFYQRKVYVPRPFRLRQGLCQRYDSRLDGLEFPVCGARAIKLEVPGERLEAPRVGLGASGAESALVVDFVNPLQVVTTYAHVEYMV